MYLAQAKLERSNTLCRTHRLGCQADTDQRFSLKSRGSVFVRLICGDINQMGGCTV
ncbi:hypothetical protein SAMN02745866_03164 [Alteromonadaceae bacterium Bs31]|nr:hypothetical protein SAMN02745866_03164 [Alteromonadaceae bacterium Bs31]